MNTPNRSEVLFLQARVARESQARCARDTLPNLHKARRRRAYLHAAVTKDIGEIVGLDLEKVSRRPLGNFPGVLFSIDELFTLARSGPSHNDCLRGR